MVTSEKARKIIRNWTKRKWKCSFISRVHHIQITLTLVGFWLATRVYNGSSKIVDLGTISAPSRNLDGAVFDGSRSLFFGGDFCVLVWNFILLLLLFFFAYGSRTLGFVIFSFMGTAYRKGLVDLDRKKKTKHHIGGLALASNFDFGNFISFYLYHLLEIFGA